MTQARAVLDFIGLPVSAPGNIECRLHKGIFRDNGTWIDDGSRTEQAQREKHRFVLSPGETIGRRVADVSMHLRKMGYAALDTSLIRHIAHHEWQPRVLTARRDRVRVAGPALRLVVRALGFDIEGRGELAIGLGKATVRPDGTAITQKSGATLHPGDPLPLVFEALDMLAEATGYQPLCAEDRSLIEHVARKLWTNEAVRKRQDAWLEADAINGERAGQARMIEFAQRLDGLRTFNPIPVGTPTPEPMRIN